MNFSDYAGTIAKVAPGTFVPDVGSTPASQSLPGDAPSRPSFKDTVKSVLDDVNAQMVDAQHKSTDLALGKTNDVEGTIKSVEEAGLAMSYTMAIRNKILQAYTDISQMQF
jgi:flagellar hook-basal body complex protein FliE